MTSEARPGDLQAFLQIHSVFSKLADIDDGDNSHNKQDFMRNLVSHNAGTDELLVFSPKTSTLFVVALNSLNKYRSEQIQVWTTIFYFIKKYNSLSF